MKINSHFYMGAINKATDKYIFPLHATKQDKYKCPSCKTDIIFKCGKINRPHFSHKSQSLCCYYNSPSETEVHKCGKRLIKRLIDDKQKLMIWRTCKCCGEADEVLTLNTNDYTDDIKCYEEHSFKFNNCNKIADVVMVDNDEIKFIFEILNTHKTNELDRPSHKWCEIDAKQFIISTMEQTNINIENQIEIECVRDVDCDKCIKERNEELKRLQEEENRLQEEENKLQEEENKLQEERLELIIEQMLDGKWEQKKEKTDCDEKQRLREEAQREKQADLFNLKKEWKRWGQKEHERYLVISKKADTSEANISKADTKYNTLERTALKRRRDRDTYWKTRIALPNVYDYAY